MTAESSVGRGQKDTVGEKQKGPESIALVTGIRQINASREEGFVLAHGSKVQLIKLGTAWGQKQKLAGPLHPK